MARLMGHNLHVMLGAVEVCKDKGNLIIRDAGAVAAAGLALGGEHVQQLPVQHGAEKYAGLRRQLIIEFLALRQNIIRRPNGTGIAGAELQCIVRKAHGIFLPQPLGLLPVDAVCQRYQIGAHRSTEFLHILLGIAFRPIR